MRAQWASCSTGGHLNFNEELLGMRGDVWDFVIVHELPHFFVPNMDSSGKASCGRTWVISSEWRASCEGLPTVIHERPHSSLNYQTPVEFAQRSLFEYFRVRIQRCHIPPSSDFDNSFASGGGRDASIFRRPTCQ
ncbi:MAG: YgjP-like metallopeptidase domain-containing protein [Chthoniobacteraceae bacterium]